MTQKRSVIRELDCPARDLTPSHDLLLALFTEPGDPRTYYRFNIGINGSPSIQVSYAIGGNSETIGVKRLTRDERNIYGNASGLLIDDGLMQPRQAVEPGTLGRPSLAHRSDELELITTTERAQKNRPSILKLNPGITVLAAPTAGGKSVAAMGFSERNDAILITYKEPFNFDNCELPISRAVSEEDLLVQIAVLLVRPDGPKFIIVDAVREFLYTADGVTGKGGLNLSFLNSMTELDALAASFGRSLVLVFNPLQTSADSHTYLMNMLRASVTGIMQIHNFAELQLETRFGASRHQIQLAYLPKWIGESLNAEGGQPSESQMMTVPAARPYGANDLFGVRVSTLSQSRTN